MPKKDQTKNDQLRNRVLRRFKAQCAKWEKDAYMVPAEGVQPPFKAALRQITKRIEQIEDASEFEAVKLLIDRAETSGKISKIYRLSCLSILCDHPRIARDAEAEEYNQEMERLAEEAQEPWRCVHKAAVERHRGHGCLRRRELAQALEHFQRATKLQFDSVQNHQNVLATLVKLDPIGAVEYWRMLHGTMPKQFLNELERRAKKDPDLFLFRGSHKLGDSP